MQYGQYQGVSFSGSSGNINNTDPNEIIRKIEKRSLRRTSTELGFFILFYFLMMTEASGILSNYISESGVVTAENSRILTFLMQIAAALVSPLLAAVFYRLISRGRSKVYLPKSHVEFKTLVPLILLGMGAAMVANNLANMFDSNISLFRLENSALFSRATKTVPEILLYALSTAVVPAFAEEFAFRGILMGTLRKYGDAFAILASSVMFGAMHGNTTQIVFAFILGLIFAFVDCKANSIVPSIIIHFLNNFHSVVIDLMNSSRTITKESVLIIYNAEVIMFCLLGILSFIYFSLKDKMFFKVSNSDKNSFSHTDVLTLKEKCKSFFTSVGIIISLGLFFLEMVFYLLPPETQKQVIKVISFE